MPEGKLGNVSLDHSSDSDGEDDDAADRSINEDPPKSNGSTCTTDLDQEDQLDPCSDAKKLLNREDREIFEGKFGFSCY